MNGEGSGGGANSVSTPYKKHLQLAVACEGGGDGANGIETPYKNHLQLTVAYEGGGGGVAGVETSYKPPPAWCEWSRTTINPPPARSCMRRGGGGGKFKPTLVQSTPHWAVRPSLGIVRLALGISTSCWVDRTPAGPFDPTLGVNLALAWAVYAGVGSEEPVTWHTNHLIAERVNRTPAAASVCAGMHASGCEGLAYRRNCRGWVSVGVVGEPGVVWVRKWVARVLTCFRC